MSLRSVSGEELEQGLQIGRHGLTLCDTADTTSAFRPIGVGENHLGQFARLDLGHVAAHLRARFIQEIADRVDLPVRPFGGFPCAFEHVEASGLPGAFNGHPLEPVVIGSLAADEVAAEMERRNVELALVVEIKVVENTSRSSIAIGKGGECLELAVPDRKTES